MESAMQGASACLTLAAQGRQSVHGEIYLISQTYLPRCFLRNCSQNLRCTLIVLAVYTVAAPEC